MVSTIYHNKAGREATPTLHSYILQNYYYYADLTNYSPPSDHTLNMFYKQLPKNLYG